MSNKILNKRQKNILYQIQPEQTYSIRVISSFFTKEDKPSIASLRRDLSELCKSNYLEKIGKLKSTVYKLTIYGAIHNPIDPHQYCSEETDIRNGNSNYNFSLFSEFPKNIFSNTETEKLDEDTKKFKEKSKDASEVIQKKELERFVIELSWKSSKIEGNTYTQIETELLLEKGIEASGHTKDEAIMIINHKKAFQYALKYKDQYKKLNILKIEGMHRILTEDMGVSFGLRSKQVGIRGSKYIPLSVPMQINEAMIELCKAIERLENPYEKALLALVGISYIQPFEDGNKRTARLIANAILLAYDCAPLSYRNVNEVTYRESTLVFYEKNSIVPMKNIFIDQYIFACDNYLQFKNKL